MKNIIKRIPVVALAFSIMIQPIIGPSIGPSIVPHIIDWLS
ncbi:hypothetical protein [Ruminococcus sp.]|nr:hypothetical protein [Ruminococcus sp.]